MISLAYISELAEQRITAAMKEGVFDNLPGSGRPLVFEDDSLVPEDCRMAYKILKNSGYLPQEVESRKEIHSILEMLAGCPVEQTRYRQIRKLNYLVTKLNVANRRHILLDMDQMYYDKTVEAITLAGE